ncbi:MAG: hypothetical protein AB9869_24980 [Verrucomicrobiia bacterium]
MNRRTLSAALQTSNLSEAALDFVKAGTATSSVDPLATAVVPPKPAAVEEPRPAADTVKRRLRINDDGEGEAEAGLVSLTVRVPRIVPPGLLLASVDRKLKRRRPWTQQEIVAEALTHWLQEHGYLS